MKKWAVKMDDGYIHLRIWEKYKGGSTFTLCGYSGHSVGEFLGLTTDFNQDGFCPNCIAKHVSNKLMEKNKDA